MHILRNYGIDMRYTKIFDTQVAAWDIDENREIGLKALSLKILGIKQLEFKTLVKVGIEKEFKRQMGFKGNQIATIDLVEVMIAGPYALDDAYCTWSLYEILKKQLIENDLVEAHLNDMTFTKCLYRAERRGIKINKKRLAILIKEVTKGIEDLQKDIFRDVGHEFNMNSNVQLPKVIYGELGFPVTVKTASGNPSCKAEVLDALSMAYYPTKRMRKNVEILDKINDCKKLMKHKTFMVKIRDEMYSDGRIHSSFNQTGTVTGRLSNSEPNLQQMPASKKDNDIRHAYNIREIFIADSDDEVLIGCDYSNLELRVLAHYSGDVNLCDCFFINQDVHGRTAYEMFDLQPPKKSTRKEREDVKLSWVKKYYGDLRQIGKTLNFGLIYGMQIPRFAGAVSRTLKREVSMSEATEMYNKYFDKYPGVQDFVQGAMNYARQHGYVLTIAGRKRRLYDINSSNRWKSSRAERQSVNSIIQGSAADIIKQAQILIEQDVMCRIYRVKVRLQIHDELIFTCKKKYAEQAIPIIRRLMEHPFSQDLDVPLGADPEAGESWAAVK